MSAASDSDIGTARRTRTPPCAAFAIAALCLLGCASETTARSHQSIVHGDADLAPERYPGVVTVSIPPNMCSGTLISLQGTTGWVLTAGHCVMPAVHFMRAAARPTEILIGADRNTQRSYAVTGVYLDPRYTQDRITVDGSVDSQLVGAAFDLALISFEGADASLASNVIPPLAPNEDTLAVGSALDVAGYGYLSPTGPIAGIRQVARVVVAQMISTPRVRSEFAVIDQRGERAGICGGDSGGPGIVDLGGGRLRVAAVSSWVTALDGTLCTEFGALQRVSTELDSFIAPILTGLPLAPPATCLACTFAQTQPGSTCSAALTDALAMGASLYRNCIETRDRAYCRMRYPSNADAFDRYWQCIQETACPTLCAPAERAYFECHEDFDGVGPCTQCTHAASACCDLEAQCRLDSMCTLCLDRVDQPAECATDDLFHRTRDCVIDACATSCGPYLEALHPITDASVERGDAASSDSAPGVSPAAGCACRAAMPGGRGLALWIALAVSILSGRRSRGPQRGSANRVGVSSS